MTVRNVDIARDLGADQSLVGRWVRRGMPTTSIEAARAWHLVHVRQKVRAVAPADRTEAPAGAETTTSPSPVSRAGMMHSMLAARLERERADAFRATMQARQLAGELVSVADVRQELAKRLVACREYLLQIPSRLAPLLAAETDPAKCFALMDAELRHALAVLAGQAES